MRLLQLTDLHFGSFPFKGEDKRTEALVRNMVKALEPDLLVLTGDIHWSLESGSLTILSGVLDFFDSLRVPVAITWGNHDSESVYNRRVLKELVYHMKHHVEKRGLASVEGRELYYFDAGNYRLYFLDSGDYDEDHNYAYVYEEQIQDLIALDGGEEKEGLLFMHIPVVEFDHAKKAGLAVGNKDEAVCAPVKNTGLVDALLKESTIRHIFVGHDHNNDFTANWRGMNLYYGRITGYNAYGDLPRGARLIELTEAGVESRIVEESLDTELSSHL